MMVERPFAETFDFARPIVAPYRDATGQLVDAAIDAPRFDHDEAGVKLGLLIDGGPRLGQGDRLLVESNDDWHEYEMMTVLHAVRLGGELLLRAYYTRAPVATVNGCLNGGGHHVSIGAFVGYLANRDGFVLYGDRKWKLMTFFSAVPSTALADASGRPLLGS